MADWTDYERHERLAAGAQTETRLVRHPETGERAVEKRLDVGDLDDWKALDLFERRVDVLASLEHPRIPSVLASFDPEENEDGAEYVLVQEYVEGPTLEEKVEREGPFSETRLRDFLSEMLDLLGYLHGFSPPVVHRDVKPSNIIVHPDEGYHLVDFGGIQHVVDDTVGGTTNFGTPGYAAPEQFMGRSDPTSDLYGLGATALFAATGREPADHVDSSGRVDLDAFDDVPDSLRGPLDRMLAGIPEERFESAERARRGLESPASVGKPGENLPVAPDDEREFPAPPGPQCRLDVDDDVLEVRAPALAAPWGLYAKYTAIGLVWFVVAPMVMFFLLDGWSPGVFLPPLLLVAAPGLLFVGLEPGRDGMVSALLDRIARYFGTTRERLRVDGETISWALETRRSGEWEPLESTSIPLDSIYLPYLDCGRHNSDVYMNPADWIRREHSRPGIYVTDERNKIRFGDRLFTTNNYNEAVFRELAWVTESIRLFLQRSDD